MSKVIGRKITVKTAVATIPYYGHARRQKTIVEDLHATKGWRKSERTRVTMETVKFDPENPEPPEDWKAGERVTYFDLNPPHEKTPEQIAAEKKWQAEREAERKKSAPYYMSAAERRRQNIKRPPTRTRRTARSS